MPGQGTVAQSCLDRCWTIYQQLWPQLMVERQGKVVLPCRRVQSISWEGRCDNHVTGNPRRGWSASRSGILKRQAALHQ